jgi:hypothetical protein
MKWPARFPHAIADVSGVGRRVAIDLVQPDGQVADAPPLSVRKYSLDV